MGLNSGIMGTFVMSSPVELGATMGRRKFCLRGEAGLEGYGRPVVVAEVAKVCRFGWVKYRNHDAVGGVFILSDDLIRSPPLGSLPTLSILVPKKQPSALW